MLSVSVPKGKAMTSNTIELNAQMPPLIPPFRFACVEAGVYRGAYPSLKNFRYLSRHQLKTVVSLVPDASEPSVDLAGFCAYSCIRHVSFTVAKYNDGFSHTADLVEDVLMLLLNPENHPLYIHCLDGRHNTGIVVMCLRKLQNWGLTAILSEFARYTKDASFQHGEKQFVSAFPAAISLPPAVPDWFHYRVVNAATDDNDVVRAGEATEL